MNTQFPGFIECPTPALRKAAERYLKSRGIRLRGAPAREVHYPGISVFNPREAYWSSWRTTEEANRLIHLSMCQEIRTLWTLPELPRKELCT